MPTATPRVYTLKRQGLDVRDHKYTDVHELPHMLPGVCDLASWLEPAKDQGPVGTCHAAATLADFCLVQKQEGLQVPALSVLFLAYWSRFLDGDPNEDAGATIRNTFKAAAGYGVCHEATWPYDVPSKLCVKPSDEACAEAKDHMAIQYQFLHQTLDELRGANVNGHGVVGGFKLVESFESAQVARTGMVPTPRPKERVLGCHAMLIVGYNDSSRRFKVLNSWGPNWGDNGYCYMPYDYVLSSALAFDFGTIQRAT